MKYIAGSILLISAFAMVVWADSPIQWRGSRGWEPESAYCRLYDAHAVITVNGKVQRVDKIIPMEGMGTGVYLTLKMEAETIPVHLGPVWFVERQPVQFHAGDLVQVTGSRIVCQGKPAILAAVVKRSDDTANFRALNGKPAWTAEKH